MQVLLAIFLMAAAYLVFWPVLIEPEARRLPEPPALIGVLTPNDRLDGAAMLTLPDGRHSPKDIAQVGDTIYTADDEGRLYRLEGDTFVPLEDLGGRPLGLSAGPDDSLLIADSYRGILRRSSDGRIDILADRVDGGPIVFANQIDVASDGVIYFSDSTTRFDPELFGGPIASLMTLWEQSDTGYVARLRPNGTTERLAEGLIFANGVALSPDEDFLVIAETGRARLVRLWLDAPRFGTSDVLIDNLPGYPDNVSAVGDGTYWVGLASPRLPSEALLPFPFLRKVIWRLGPLVRPDAVHHGRVLRVDAEGNILDMLEDPRGRFAVITGATEIDGQLYVTSLDSGAVGRIDTP